MKKIGLSGIVSVVILIALVVVMVGIVWGVINGIIQKNIQQTEACFGIFDKVNINSEFTCYNYLDTNKKVNLTINIEDIEIDGLLISIEDDATSKTFTITEDGASGVTLLDNRLWENVLNKNSGSTLEVELPGNFGELKSIKIAPIVNNKQCEISDSLLNIPAC